MSQLVANPINSMLGYSSSGTDPIHTGWVGAWGVGDTSLGACTHHSHAIILLPLDQAKSPLDYLYIPCYSHSSSGLSSPGPPLTFNVAL